MNDGEMEARTETAVPRQQTSGLESLNEIGAGHLEALEGYALIKTSAQTGGSSRNKVLLFIPHS